VSLRIHLVGFGAVGRALAPLLSERSEFRVVAISDSRGTLARPDGVNLDAAVRAKERDGRLPADSKPDADVPCDLLVDATPTRFDRLDPAVSRLRRALGAGRHVVTANKGPVATRGPELAGLAQGKGVLFRRSATVCAGTPVLELLASAFGGDRVLRIEGVLNGSTNAVLSLVEGGCALEEALLECRRRAYLEADPSLDLSGLDAAAKAAILHQAAFGPLAVGAVDRRGIFDLAPSEVQDAARTGLAIRSVATILPGRASVRPVALARDHPLVVGGVENVVRLKLARAGEIVLRGPGAGSCPTAAAVLSDCLAIANASHRPASSIAWGSAKHASHVPASIPS